VRSRQVVLAEPESPGPHTVMMTRVTGAPDAQSTDDTQRPTAPAASNHAHDTNDDTFEGLGLGAQIVATLTELGYEEPTPIQRAAIRHLLAGGDVLAEAPTGTGKTAAFALPAIQRLADERDRILAGDPRRSRSDGQVAMLVLVPTRELAMQVSEAIHRYGARLGIRALPVYGGQAIGLQLRALRSGVDVVVATPGRAVDHLKRGSLRLDAVRVVVLDEADEMLDMGFAEDLDTVLAATPGDRQTALFSATLSPVIARVAKRHLRDAVRVSVKAAGPTDATSGTIRQVAYVVRRQDKLAALSRILDLEDPTSALVFARTRGEVDDLAERLSGRGHDAAALHGGLSQEQRDRIMARFREGALDVLVATDVAARGLDIEHVSHVVNYDVPTDPDSYVHRIGRTGRAGRDGVAITIVEPREHRLLRNIEKVVGTRLGMGEIPSVADLRAHRLDLLQATIRGQIADKDNERYRAVIEPLSDEFDLMDIALAAVSIADAGRGDEDERDIAPASLFEDRPVKGRAVPGRPGPGPRPGGPGPRPSDGGRSPGRAGGRQGPGGPGAGGWARLWIGGGRRAGLRPGDIVGAITHEAGVTGGDVGAIQIADSFALVDVRQEVAERVHNALEAATIRGKVIPVRRDW
jgi:ATP-dependent RNA helicase DeaD